MQLLCEHGVNAIVCKLHFPPWPTPLVASIQPGCTPPKQQAPHVREDTGAWPLQHPKPYYSVMNDEILTSHLWTCPRYGNIHKWRQATKGRGPGGTLKRGRIGGRFFVKFAWRHLWMVPKFLSLLHGSFIHLSLKMQPLLLSCWMSHLNIRNRKKVCTILIVK